MKEFIKLNVDMDKIVKNAKHIELNRKITSSVLNRKTLKMI